MATTTIRLGGASMPRLPRPSLPVAVGILVGLLVLPNVCVVLLASLHTGTTLPFDAAPLTLNAYGALLSDPVTYRVALNTLLYAAVSLAISLGLAVSLVWLVERTDLPFRSAVPALLFIPLSVPGAVLAMGWALLLAPRTGFLNVWLRALGGTTAVTANTTGPLNVYSFPGLVLLTGIGIAPSMFFMLAAAFANMDSQLEEAGATSGAGIGTVLRRVTLPLLAPALTATAIYYVILLFETFEIPLVIGPNAGFRVLSVQIYELVHPATTPPEYGAAGAFGSVLILVGLALAWLYARVSADAARYAVIRGKGGSRQVVRLGPWRYVAFGAIVLYLVLAIALPLAALAWTSLFPAYRPLSLDALGAASFRVYGAVFADPRWANVLVNTSTIVVVASVAVTALALVVSWIVVRHRGGTMRWLDSLAFLPRTIPGVVLAMGVFLLLIRTPLYATIWILVVAYVINFLPYCVRVMNATLLQIDRELEEAAYVSGAGVRTTLFRVVLPLMRPAVTNCILWVMAHAVRDFTFALILGTASNAVVSQLLWQTWAVGDLPRTSAMAMLLCAALLLVFVPLRWRLGARAVS